MILCKKCISSLECFVTFQVNYSVNSTSYNLQEEDKNVEANKLVNLRKKLRKVVDFDTFKVFREVTTLTID